MNRSASIPGAGFCSGLLALVLQLPLAAQAASDAPTEPAPKSRFWDAAQLSQPTYKVRTEFNVRIPMRDGVMVSVDIFHPDAPGRYPTLIWRTPYSNNNDSEIAQGKWYAARGYVVVKADVRGKYDSDGEWYAYRHEADDGYDTDEWIGKQPWSNGRIGLAGGSYLGYTEIAQAIRGSQYLRSMTASVTTSDIYNNWAYIDGAFFYGFAFPWGGQSMNGHVGQTRNPDDWPRAYLNLPIATSDAAAGHISPSYRDWLAHPLRTDPYWNDISLEDRVHEIGIPYLTIDGWYDLFMRGAIADHLKIRAHGRTEAARKGKRLILGPWSHDTGVRFVNPPSATDRGIDFGPDAELNPQFIYLRWHDHYLKDIDNGVDRDAPVTIFVMGENQWRDEQEWPLARTRYTKYYLASSGKANTAAGDGTLGTRLPGGAATDQFDYDPADPVPTAGGNTCCSSVPSGPFDQRQVEARDDVLVYTTPALTEAVEVTGPLQMKLYAATSARDTDWTVKLVDVHPDGYAQNIQDGIIRARYNGTIGKSATLVEPGKIDEYTIDMWATSNVFLPGHRIRLEISSSNFPRFDRNLNTGEDPATGTRMERARQTVHHSKRYPSHVILPIIPRPSLRSAATPR
jgi:putative CocE/NonD family hydrolase